MNNPEGPLGSHAALSSQHASTLEATELEATESELEATEPELEATEPELDKFEIDESDIRILQPYGDWLSDEGTLVGLGDDRTLVGLGPPSSRRPAADTAEKTGRRLVSEPPGPWGSVEEGDEQVPRSLLPRRGGIWAAAIPLLLLFAGIAVLALRGLTPSSRGSGHAAASVEPSVRDGTGVFVRLATLDARVFVDGIDRGPPPVLLLDLEPGSHVVVVSGDGYVPFEQPVTLIAGHVSTLDPVLTRVTAAPPPPELAAVEAATSERTPGPASNSVGSAAKSPLLWRGARPPVHAVKPVAVNLEEAPSELGLPPPTGLLALSSDPPSSVVVDGRPVGKSPRALDLVPGVHHVIFIHPEFGRRTLTVNVTPGKTTSAAVDF